MHEFAAAAFLVVLVILLAGALILAFARSPFTPVQTLLYWGSIALVRLLWRVEVKGQLHFPADRGAVVVANHRSSVDPFFLQTLTLRKMHWMVAKEFFSHPLFGAFLNAVESIPTSRGAASRTATSPPSSDAVARSRSCAPPTGRRDRSGSGWRSTR